jgi:hypothetical protein
MANNRYLEIIKRLLTAETYFRWRDEAKEREQERQRRNDDREPDVPQ